MHNDLIRQAKKQDKQAFSTLYDMYLKDLYKIAKAILKRDEDEKMNFGTFIWILDEDGNRLEHNEGSAVGGSSKLTTISTKENSII